MLPKRDAEVDKDHRCWNNRRRQAEAPECPEPLHNLWALPCMKAIDRVMKAYGRVRKLSGEQTEFVRAELSKLIEI